jgi:starch synthase
VENFDEATGAGTGFKLWDLSANSLVETVKWAIDTWRGRPDAFRAMQQRAMRKQFGWKVAAQNYAELYGWALERRRWTEKH